MTTRLRPYADFFAWFRKYLGISQQDMASALGCTRSVFNRIERGGVKPSLLTVELAYCLAKQQQLHVGDPTPFYRVHALLARHVGGANG